MRSWVASLLVVVTVGVAQADVVSDQPTAILIWPDVIVDEEGSTQTADTILQISNTSQEAVRAHCFHENANYHCSNTGEICVFPQDCCSPGSDCGTCDPGWLETDFYINITPRQPLGWRASEGMGRDDVPLDGGRGGTGIGGSSNAGTNIPRVAEIPYNGALKCIAVNSDDTPSDRNVLKGEATRVARNLGVSAGWTVAKHNAIGIRAIEGAVNDDNELVLGGGDAEYEGCPEQLVVNHLFDSVTHPIFLANPDSGVVPAIASGAGLPGRALSVFTRLTLIPCTQDLLRQIPGSAVAQFLVYNEFEQRFSTSRTVNCKFERLMSLIDTTDPERSIFSVGVSGTVVGQSRIRAVGHGLIGVAAEGHRTEGLDAVVSGGLTNSGGRKVMALGNPFFGFRSIDGFDQSDFNIHQQGDRAESDIITLP